MASKFAAVTIASKAYLSLARVTARSFREHHPDIPFILLLTDEVDGFFDPDSEPFALLSLGSLGISQLARFRFQYAQQELSYAATPYVIASLLEQGYDGVIFLKQETLVLDTLTPLFEGLQRHPLLLTPHLLEPLSQPDAAWRELDVLRAGVYNGGVVSVANAPVARKFLEWWQARTFSDCFCLVEEGLHYEQRWLDFAPSLVPGTMIIRDPGVNIGHWNLAERQVAIEQGKVTAKGVPCRIFRFSGYDPNHPERITKYYPARLTTETPDVHQVFDRYHRLLMQEGFQQTSGWPYAYGSYDNGAEVTATHRYLYRQLGEQGLNFGDPLVTSGAKSYWHWLVRNRKENS